MSAPGSSSNVIVRFMALLDVALILVGVLIVILLQIDPRSSAVGGGDAVARSAADVTSNGQGNQAVVPSARIESDAEAAIRQQIRFVNVFAGWQNEQDGRAYLLTSEMRIGDEVPLDKKDWIDALGTGGKQNVVALLVFERNGWFPAWTQQKLAAVQRSWGIQVIPIYNVSLPPR